MGRNSVKYNPADIKTGLAGWFQLSNVPCLFQATFRSFVFAPLGIDSPHFLGRTGAVVPFLFASRGIDDA